MEKRNSILPEPNTDSLVVPFPNTVSCPYLQVLHSRTQPQVETIWGENYRKLQKQNLNLPRAEH